MFTLTRSQGLYQILGLGLLFITLVGVSACTPSDNPATPTPMPRPANQASEFCEAQDFEVEVREEAGEVVGYCVFADGSECEEWAYYTGECGPPQWEAERLDLAILESFPVQVQAGLAGTLPSTCTEIERVEQTLDSDTRIFQVDLIIMKSIGEDCRDNPVPFEEIIALEVRDLKAGEYTVIFGEVEETFTLEADNSIPDE